MEEVWTVRKTLDWCCGYLERHADENPRLSAQWLLCEATGLTRVELYTNFDKPLSADERSVLRASLKCRAAGEPLQYISGEAAFRHIVVKTAHGVLIPRPETELLVEQVISFLSGRESSRVLEVGTGTGCIALSLAKEVHAQVVATDISPDALACAMKNCEMLGLEDYVDIVEADCCEGIDGPFDVLVSNPPYIPTALIAELPREVAGFEPALALDGGSDGLEFFERLVESAPRVLVSGGLFACELHEECCEQAATRLEAAGFADVRVVEDLAGKQRIVCAHRV